MLPERVPPRVRGLASQHYFIFQVRDNGVKATVLSHMNFMDAQIPHVLQKRLAVGKTGAISKSHPGCGAVNDGYSSSRKLSCR